ncbi:MAG TPA: hypothetical protein DCK99_10380 [Blastocatellia bacterium]|jgi:hypothetical protein|nr:hypothetical protein [Blastocatellia bacterium]
MTSKDKKLTVDAGTGKFVQLTGKETDEEIEQIADEMSAALGFGTEKKSETDFEHTGASSNTSSDGIQVEPETVLDVAKQHLGEAPLSMAIGNPNVKFGANKHSPSADQEWNGLTDNLALCLANLVEDDYLVISYKRVNYYLQFAAQGQFGMRVEAASNAYIVPAQARLSPEGYVAMDQLGWQTPTVLPEGITDPDGSPNFFVDLPSPVDFKSLSELAIRTFRQIYGMRHPGQLQYKAFSSGGAQIRFPTLRLKWEG